MSGLVSPAVRAARPVAVAAVESPASAYGVVDAIVFALDSAGLLQSPEVTAELVALRARVVELEQQLAAAGSRGRARGHVAGLREAAEIVDVDDDCECGGCDSCTARQDAARIRAHADLLTAALGGTAGGERS